MSTTAPLALETKPASARRILIHAEQVEKARVAEQRRLLQESLRELITELNLPALQRLAEAATSQAGQVASFPGMLTEAANRIVEAQRRTRRLIWLALATMGLMVAGFSAVAWGSLVKVKALPQAQATMLTEIEAQNAKRTALTAQLAKMDAEVQAMISQRDSVREQITYLQTRAEASRDALTQAAGVLTALGQAREQAQNEIAKLQRISQTFQFRLLEGKSGMVFVEIPDTAEPFTHGGKRLIAVNSPPQ